MKGSSGVGLVQGEIVWVRGEQMGVTFHETIDPKLARRPVTAREDDHLLKPVNLGRIRRPGLRID